MITVLLVDDGPPARLGLRLRLALEPDMTVVGDVDNRAASVALVTALRPDVVVMDAATAGGDWAASATTLGRLACHSPVVALSLRDDPLTQRRALAAGATAFVSKWDSPDTLLAVIRRLARPSRERSA